MQPVGCLRFFVFGIALIAVAIGFSSCSTPMTPAGRAAAAPQITAALPQAHRDAAMQGRLVEGMSPDAVLIAWGRPDRVTRGRSGGTAFETWRYLSPRAVQGNYYANPNYLYHRGRYHMLPPRVIDMQPQYVQELSAIVTFKNGRVSGWESR